MIGASTPSGTVGPLHIAKHSGTRPRSATRSTSPFDHTKSNVASCTSHAIGIFQSPNTLLPSAGASTNSTSFSPASRINFAVNCALALNSGNVNHRSCSCSANPSSIIRSPLISGSNTFSRSQNMADHHP